MREIIKIQDNQIAIKRRLVTTAKGTIIFLHHSSGSSSVWDQQWQSKTLSNYSLIALDLLGHGGSSHSNNPEQDYSLQGLAGIMAKAINALTIDSYILVGLSISTNLIAEMANQLDSCAGFFMAGASILSKEMSPADFMLSFEFGDVLFAVDPKEDCLTGYVKGLHENQKDNIDLALISDYKNTDPAYRISIGNSVGSNQWSDELQILNKLQKPLGLVYGAEEKIITPHYLTSISLPKWEGKVHLLDAAGHLCHLDQPKLFNQLLAQFIIDVLQL